MNKPIQLIGSLRTAASLVLSAFICPDKLLEITLCGVKIWHMRYFRKQPHLLQIQVVGFERRAAY